MKRVVKWLSIIAGALALLIILAVLIAPVLFDVQKYKPEIERRVSGAVGRPFAIGGDLQLSIFPWIGLALSDLRLGNPPGFAEKDFLTVKSFEVRVKLLPLLFRDIEVKRFVIEGPRIALERTRDGRASWEGLEKPAPAIKKAPEEKTWAGLPVKGLVMRDFSIRDGVVLWIDHTKGERREIRDLVVGLEDVSLEKPIGISISGRLDKWPIALKGKVGPVGQRPGSGVLPLDLSLKGADQVDIKLWGRLVDAAVRPRFDFRFEVSPFSPRKLLAALGKPLPAGLADGTLDLMSMKGRFRGDRESVTIQDGVLNVDDSNLVFSGKVTEFSRPNVSFNLRLDRMDIGRYPLPLGRRPAKEGKKTDYSKLRKLVLDGEIRAGKLKMQRAQVQNLYVKVSGQNGIFTFDPFTFRLYEGKLLAKGTLDLRRDTPRSKVSIQAEGLAVRPLLNDLLKKDFLEGAISAQLAVTMEGTDAKKLKRTLNGKGELLVKDGALVGVDLSGMVRNVEVAFGLAEKGARQARTDFSELYSPFTLTKGVFKTAKTTLKSPFLRVQARGQADLVRETLHFRLEPEFVAILKGQGDRVGFMVPVLVTGDFSAPKFSPDLEGIIRQEVEKRILRLPELQDQSKEEGKPQPFEERVKGLLKGLF